MSKNTIRKNFNGRLIVVNRANDFIKYILKVASNYRKNNPPGWSDTLSIPMCQKILIDLQYEQSQKYEWKDELSQMFIEWFFHKYYNETIYDKDNKKITLNELSERNKRDIKRIFKATCGR